MTSATRTPRQRLVYLVTEDWAFLTHRLPMARAARDAGYEVHVATRVGRHRAAIEAEGFHCHAINLYRGSINPLNILAAVRAVRRLLRDVQPDIVHNIALQTVVLSLIAGFGLPPVIVNSIVGFGSVFTADTTKSRVVRAALRLLLPILLNRKNSQTLVLNPEDRMRLIDLGVAPDRITLFPGSGVDIERFTPCPEPPGPITAAYAGRMLEDKGIRALVKAQQILTQQGTPVQLLMAGTSDPANPNSIPQATLESWSRQPGVTWLGHVEDIRTVWARAHIAVLASHGEGLPVSLLEAAACGRPIVATDVSGCREIACADVNALLVPTEDAQALADAIGRLAGDAKMRQRLGTAGRRLVEREYSSTRVGQEIVSIYRRLAGAPVRVN